MDSECSLSVLFIRSVLCCVLSTHISLLSEALSTCCLRLYVGLHSLCTSSFSDL